MKRQELCIIDHFNLITPTKVIIDSRKSLKRIQKFMKENNIKIKLTNTENL